MTITLNDAEMIRLQQIMEKRVADDLEYVSTPAAIKKLKIDKEIYDQLFMFEPPAYKTKFDAKFNQIISELNVHVDGLEE